MNLPLCSRCKERPAVIFAGPMASGKMPEGYCLRCAKELKIPQVEEMMKHFGITDDMVDNMESEITNMMGMFGADGMDELFPDNDDTEETGLTTKEEDDDFTPGGAATFPALFQKFTSPDGGDAHAEGEPRLRRPNKRKNKRKNLSAYCTNLSEKAERGELDPMIGRENELHRVVQILCRRQKNNPCFIGEPGVGKTAIAEGLALQIVQGNVPYRLKKKEVHVLDMTALVAGTQFRGQFEARMKALIQEIKDDGNILLFIDEIHSLVGAGESEGAMNAANILKPALSRGEIQVIGATTFREYRKYIEKDSALERRFQPVTVSEPSIKETEAILRGIAPYYEQFHRVQIPPAVLDSMATLSERYINDRFLPDKAIDLLDESCASAALRNEPMARYDTVVDSIESLRQEEQALTSGEGEPDYEKLASLRWELSKLEEEEAKLAPEALSCQVTEADVASVIFLWTGIPQNRIEESELQKLSELPKALAKKVIGQQEAVEAVAAAIRRSKVQISPRRHPASFLFVGPTGVGKTELCKVLSKELFDTPETLIRLDMSEYMEKHSVSRIIGSPPGYVGYDEAGQVTEQVRRRPYSVLLFDEIEKAHPDVMNILLQILDEGHITDAGGRNVNFEHTVIIMTSNAGSEKKESALGFAKTEAEANKDRVMQSLSEFLRPEFLARIDEIVLFRSLNQEDYAKIADLLLGEYRESLSERHITLQYDQAVCQHLAKKSIGGKSGARDLRNLIRRQVEDKIATALVDHYSTPISAVVLSVEHEELQLNTL